VIRLAPIHGLLLGLLPLLAGCGRPSAPPPVKVAEESEASWTPEKIADEPDRYLQFADRRIREQVGQREKKLADLATRRAEVEAKSSQLLRRVEEARNLRDRLDKAILRAEDEDRWPMVFAGRSFSREKSTALREGIVAFEQQREPLATAYKDALARIDQSHRALRADIASLGQVREAIGTRDISPLGDINRVVFDRAIESREFQSEANRQE
jgi:hypothetical protein